VIHAQRAALATFPALSLVHAIPHLAPRTECHPVRLSGEQPDEYDRAFHISGARKMSRGQVRLGVWPPPAPQ
jgi:hypothetical protein